MTSAVSPYSRWYEKNSSIDFSLWLRSSSFNPLDSRNFVSIECRILSIKAFAHSLEIKKNKCLIDYSRLENIFWPLNLSLAFFLKWRLSPFIFISNFLPRKKSTSMTNEVRRLSREERKIEFVLAKARLNKKCFVN